MLRQHIATAKRRTTDRIEWRNLEVLRIEAFSDAVFAFAITLLIVSLEVPKTFHELIENLRGFIPFAICFILVFQVWYTQNIFFRRFGLHDFWTVMLNGALVFVVLFFMYPLKFLYNALFSSMVLQLQDAQALFYIYSSGFAAIYLIFALLYWHAARNQREHIGLTDEEIFEAKTSLYQYLLMVGIALCSIVLAFSGTRAGLISAGFIYILLGPGVGILHGKRARISKRRFGDPAANSVPDRIQEGKTD